MTHDDPSLALHGKLAWLITNGRAGVDIQARGVADHLGLVSVVKPIEPRALFRLLAPWGPLDPGLRFGRPGSPLSPPWPDVAIAVGQSSMPCLRAVRQASGGRCFTIVLLDPKSSERSADVFWVPEHDQRRGDNVITTLTTPHGFSPELLERRRAGVPPAAIAALPAPRIAVHLGGNNAVFRFTAADHLRLADALRSLAALGVSFLVTSSRRTHAGLLQAVNDATEGAPRLVWDGQHPNPYVDFLAQANALIVTADSVNMCSEAAATGRPLFVFTPSGGSAKFKRFHEALAAAGVSRPLPNRFETLASWSYRPLHAARPIADEIARRYVRWAAHGEARQR